MDATTLTLAQIKGRRILYLVFATVTLLVLGLIYAWSIFAAPIGRTFEAYQPLLPQVFQVSMFAFCLSALVGAQIVKKFSAKAAIIVAAILMAVGFVLTALLAGVDIWMLFLFYGIIAGSGCGIAYNAIISLVNPWFPDRIGLCSGIMMMGFGISSLVFGSLANALFGIMDWQMVFFLIAAVAFVIMLALAFVVKPAPQGIGATLGIERAAAAAKSSPTQQQFILKTKTFWFYSVWSVIIVACGLAIIGTAAQGAARLELDTTIFAGFGALLVGLISTMNGLSRIINGAIFDKMGLLPVMVLSAILAIACMLGLSASLAVSLGPLYIVAAILVALPYGSVPVMASAFSRQRFGAQNFAMNLGITNCCIAAAATVNLIINAIFGSPAGENGPIIYGILAALAVVAFLIIFVFNRAYKTDLAAIAKELD
ncbi:MAG: MFS transporter [Coriobacteriales bacterium]|jgi:OFA family oxalate/formate antiporter-like MFS transporter|nr:MFS transporter [Coriobacteriales bacterium]